MKSLPGPACTHADRADEGLIGECTSTARACISISSREGPADVSFGLSGTLAVLLPTAPMTVDSRPFNSVAATTESPRTRHVIRPNTSGRSGENHSDGGTAENRAWITCRLSPLSAAGNVQCKLKLGAAQQEQ